MRHQNMLKSAKEKKPTVTHAEYDAGLLHSSFYAQAIFDGGRHGLLAQDIVSLRGEGFHELGVQMVLDSDDNSICEPLPNGRDRLGRRVVEVFPGVEDETTVDMVLVCDKLPGLGPRLRNCNNFALGRGIQRIFCVTLSYVFVVCEDAQIATKRAWLLTLPR